MPRPISLAMPRPISLAMPLQLCDRCLQSFSPEEFTQVEGDLVCGECAPPRAHEPEPPMARVAVEPVATSRGILSGFLTDAGAWCQDRTWILRVPPSLT